MKVYSAPVEGSLHIHNDTKKRILRSIESLVRDIDSLSDKEIRELDLGIIYQEAVDFLDSQVR